MQAYFLAHHTQPALYARARRFFGSWASAWPQPASTIT